MPYKTGSRERLYGWKSEPRDPRPFQNRQTDRWKGYNTERWKRESRVWKMAHPVCEECRRKGITKAAEITDHIIPALVCPDPWDKSNWQSLCKSCNLGKGNEDRKMIQGCKHTKKQ